MRQQMSSQLSHCSGILSKTKNDMLMTLLTTAANDDRKQFTERSGRRIAKHKAFLLMNELSSLGQQTFGLFSLR